jgi:site-specific DNA-methyltransferase (adenine-specific)
VIALNKIYNEDCLQGMQRIADKSVDMILCDLPYGTTACKWDTIIPFEPLWKQYGRIIKDNGAIVLTASQPFTSALVMSNLKMFKYCWVWEKDNGTNFFLAKQQPMKVHEDICIFSKGAASFSKKGNMVYNPILTEGSPYTAKANDKGLMTFHTKSQNKKKDNSGTRYPKSIQKFNSQKGLHPTQKPVPLFEYLIKTYTNEGETVLDNCMGSGTTAIAAINTNRNFIGFEKDETYHALACERIQRHTQEKASQPLDLFSQAS